MDSVSPDTPSTCRLLEQVRNGDARALDELLTRHRPALHAFVAARLDRPLRGRLDPSDVVQEAQMEVARRMSDYLDRRPMPFHLWVRKTAYERLLNLRRDHRQAARRSVEREVGLPERSSLLERVVTLTGAPVATLQWDVRLKDERGQSILAGTGDTPEAALQAAIDQGSASIARADGAA